MSIDFKQKKNLAYDEMILIENQIRSPDHNNDETWILRSRIIFPPFAFKNKRLYNLLFRYKKYHTVYSNASKLIIFKFFKEMILIPNQSKVQY